MLVVWHASCAVVNVDIVGGIIYSVTSGSWWCVTNDHRIHRLSESRKKILMKFWNCWLNHWSHFQSWFPRDFPATGDKNVLFPYSTLLHTLLYTAKVLYSNRGGCFTAIILLENVSLCNTSQKLMLLPQSPNLVKKRNKKTTPKQKLEVW